MNQIHITLSQPISKRFNKQINVHILTYNSKLMHRLQEIRTKMLREIEDLDGGWAALSRKTGYTTVFLQRTLDKKSVSTPRLATLEKIKEGIKQCVEDNKKRVEALLS